MKKVMSILLASAMILVLAAGCGESAAPTQSAAPDTAAPQEGAAADTADLPEVTIHVASIFEPGTAILKGIDKFGELLEEKSGGKITLSVYASGSTGGEKEQAEALKLGEIDMAAFGTLPISIFTPEYSFFDSPFVFRDKDHFMAVWNGELGDAMRKQMLDGHNLYTLGVMGRGYRHITSNTPIESVDDIAKLTIRTPESALFMDTFGALGATCVPIALPELFTSLQMGVVNASEGPFDQLVTNKLYEVQDYITLSKYYYSISMWQMNAGFYNGLPEAYRAMIDEAAAEATEYATALGEEMEAELRAQCEDAGVTFCEMTDLQPYLDKVKPAMDKFYAEKWPVTTAEEIASY